MSKHSQSEKERVIIFDTTLRDGEQSPGATMSLSEKIEIAILLDEMGVDVIEAGFPIASEGDFRAVSEISNLVNEATVCGLARSSLEDIDRAAEALRQARSKRIHTFISTSPLHMEFKLQMKPDDVIEAIERSVARACKYTDDVQWSPEDGTRTEHDFLCRAVETAIKAGATTINIPDTVGYTAPEESAGIIRMLKKRVPAIDRVVISTHCHNDLGMAVANSLAAVSAGARQIECTINGLGERAGNAALEEVVMAMRVRSDIMPYRTGIDTTRILQASRLVSSATGFPVQYNKAIVGKNAFAHEAGIHQDGMLKHSETYEIMRPEDVGIAQSNLVLGKHSGRAALRVKLEQLGYSVGDNRLKVIFARFKNLADKKKEVFDDDLIALMQTTPRDSDDEFMQIKYLRVVCGSESPQEADIVLVAGGEELRASSTGDGPVDAAFNAINSLFDHSAKLELYQVQAVTEGTDAQATVSVRLEENGKIVVGQSSDTDTVFASAKAYVSALNNLIHRRKKSAPAAASAG
ncbi:MAG: 2-isopropylmalate synthase [Albidovulum sp.]|nr:2-isopropylmalate synthase [Albidovulum sp.]MDE0530229.1 2-isopropylmalate synthase [Albidovulum sp.]